MKSLTNRVLTSAIASLLSLAGFVNADYYGGPGDYCCGSPAYCCEPCDPCGEFFIEADALYWRTNADGLSFGDEYIKGGCLPDGETFIERVHAKNLHRKWDWGFRVGLGYRLPCDCWDIEAYWTHFQTKQHARWDIDDANSAIAKYTCGSLTPTVTFLPTNRTPNVNGFTNNLQNGTVVDPVTNTGAFSKARWHFDLDYFDVELGRTFCVSRCVKLRPHVGIRGARLDQKYHQFNDYVVTGSSSSNYEEIHLKSDFHGIGVRGGLDSDWDLGCNFSIYGEAAASLLAGEFNTHESAENTRGTTTGSTTATVYSYEFHDKFWACRAITDAAIGLRWRIMCDCDRSVFTVSLGWEHHLFFGQNKLPLIEEYYAGYEANHPRYGDICTHGAVLSLRYDF